MHALDQRSAVQGFRRHPQHALEGRIGAHDAAVGADHAEQVERQVEHPVAFELGLEPAPHVRAQGPQAPGHQQHQAADEEDDHPLRHGGLRDVGRDAQAQPLPRRIEADDVADVGLQFHRRVGAKHALLGLQHQPVLL
jgi:hypothetical protein